MFSLTAPSDALLTEGLLTAKAVMERLSQSGQRVVTAESCTGGLVSALLVHHAGASDCVEGAFVTYSNQLKHSALDVRDETLARFGAVSAETVTEMAEGALCAAARATVAVSVSGIAGPGGGSDEKPVGLVWFGLAVNGKKIKAASQNFEGSRTEIRWQAALYALQLIAGYDE
ncbi:CinA family protein [Acetobacter thailandicus]|uniref:CinA family protein n=1 Tax=Acetobacter thailandicus TaxID=1502842 RepID=A0ABT3QG21_9PROT|nr:CinA family protein [Acetobacter thailandicus]MBS0979893.1 CinA family protein [Acetobacter thailandicus]MCX2564206.1 CinA family protein [Acetobacter thailandicus]NHN95550.1 nicotinamide-nucleotide amidohydrolase family protein [Acetobacter thailandicus]